MSGLIETLRKTGIYASISIAGFVFLFKYFFNHKKVDKKFMTKDKKYTMKKLRYLFSSVNLGNIDHIRFVSFSSKNELHAFANKKEKLIKMNDCIYHLIQETISKQQPTPHTYLEVKDEYNEDLDRDREEEEYGYSKQKPVKEVRAAKYDKSDKIFFSLFHNISKIYQKES